MPMCPESNSSIIIYASSVELRCRLMMHPFRNVNSQSLYLDSLNERPVSNTCSNVRNSVLFFVLFAMISGYTSKILVYL